MVETYQYENNECKMTPWAASSASYTYDAMGNIATITGPYKNKKSVKRTYTYDAQNQLLSETIGSDTTSYTYDTAGNIRSITGPSVSKSFSYNDSGDWKDLLTSVTVNGTTRSITYEEENGVTIGNPLSYFNGTQYTLAWQNGRQLASLSGGGKSATYTYGADGIRTGKTVTDASGTTTYQYTTQNGQIARQSWTAGGTAYQMDFIYDATGRPLAMYYRSKTASQTDFNGDSYYYETNQQGDVTGLYKITYDASTKALTATRVASYEYDAWGNVTYSTGTMAKTNPLKYRGYYYDAETGFYYLQSRYYDPAIGRFVNADGFTSTGQGFLGCNMFAYCHNNPISNIDITGYVIVSWNEIVMTGSLSNAIEAYGRTFEEALNPSAWTGLTQAMASPNTEHSFTFSIGAVLSGALYGGGNVSSVLSCDTGANYALQSTRTLQIGSSTGFSNGAVITITNAPAVYCLNGAAKQIGGTIAIGRGLGVDVFEFVNPITNDVYHGISISYLVGAEAEAHIGDSTTDTAWMFHGWR